MPHAIPNTQSIEPLAPRLEAFLNLDTLTNLPDWSTAPGEDLGERAAAIRTAGYTGVQGADAQAYREHGLKVCTLGRANTIDEIRQSAQRWSDEGYLCATMHIGWGFEDDAEVDRLVGAVIDASQSFEIPLYIETHRATITQDPWRTLRLIDVHPEVRFNADFSHWYTGLELVYGGIEWKLDLLKPVFERTAFMHARVGNAGHIQVPLADPTMETAMKHYRDMWTRAMAGWLSGAGPGDSLIFAPELLQSGNNYARLYQSADGTWQEDSDRWQESLELVSVARECFAEAASQA